ncbi:MAG: hypothetical protein N2748_01165, partial [candidate division WOR-3 bacterium]|nr:hypothetical protein [candidate division WOR-3 bacterium]
MLLNTRKSLRLLIVGTLFLSLVICGVFCAKKRSERKQPQVKVEWYSPKAGEVLSQILVKASVPANIQSQMIDKLKKINFNFKSLNPNDTLKFFYRNDTLLRMELKKNYATVYCLDNLTSPNISVSMKYVYLSL